MAFGNKQRPSGLLVALAIGATMFAGCRKGQDLSGHASTTDNRQGAATPEGSKAADKPEAQTENKDFEFSSVGNDGRTIWTGAPDAAILANRNYGLVRPETAAFYGLTSTSSIYWLNRPDQINTAATFTDMEETISESDAAIVAQQACNDYYPGSTLRACMQNFATNSGVVFFQPVTPLTETSDNDPNVALNYLRNTLALVPIDASPNGVNTHLFGVTCVSCHASKNVLPGDDNTMQMHYDVRGTNDEADGAEPFAPLTVWNNVKANAANPAYPLWSKSTWLHNVGALSAQGLKYWQTYGNNPGNYHGVLTEANLESSMNNATTDRAIGAMWLYAYLTVSTSAAAYSSTGDTQITDPSVQIKTERADFEEFLPPSLPSVVFTPLNSTSIGPGNFSAPGHGLSTGESVAVATTGALPGIPGQQVLQPNTPYYAIVIDANTFTLATSQQNAAAGIAISIYGQSCAYSPYPCGGSGVQSVIPLQGPIGAGSRYNIALAATNFPAGFGPPIRNQRPLDGLGGTSGMGGNRNFAFPYLDYNMNTCGSGCNLPWSVPSVLTEDTKRLLLAATGVSGTMPNSYDSALASSWGFASSAAALSSIKSTVGRVVLNNFAASAQAYYNLRFANPLPVPYQYAPKIALSKFTVAEAWREANCESCHTANIVSMQPNFTPGSDWANCTIQTEGQMQAGGPVCQFAISQATTQYVPSNTVQSASTIFADQIATAIGTTSSPMQGMATESSGYLGLNMNVGHDASRIPLVRNGMLAPWGASSAQNFLAKLPANGGTRTPKKWVVYTGAVDAYGPRVRILPNSPVAFDGTSNPSQLLQCWDSAKYTINSVIYTCQQALKYVGWLPRLVDDPTNLFAQLHSDLAANGGCPNGPGIQCITRAADAVAQNTLSVAAFSGSTQAAQIADFNNTLAQILFGMRVGRLLIYDDSDPRNASTPTYFKAITLVGMKYPEYNVSTPSGSSSVPFDGANNIVSITAKLTECLQSAIVFCTGVYTTDGSTPTYPLTGTSKLYTAPFTVAPNTTLKTTYIHDGAAGLSPVNTVQYVQAIAPTPSLSLPSGAYNQAQTVSFYQSGIPSGSSCNGAPYCASTTFYYTLDGSTPTTSSPSGTAVTLSANTTLKVILTGTGYLPSAVQTATYTFATGNVIFNPPSSSLTSATNVSLNISTNQSASITYIYTTDGSIPSATNGTSVTSYNNSVQVPVTSSLTLKAIACLSPFPCSAVSTATYVMNAAAVATPTVSPGTGSFSGPVSVSISTATSGATIYYTTNGTAPSTSSSVYGGSFTLSATATVNALAVKSGQPNSAVGTATLTIGGGGGGGGSGGGGGGGSPASTPTFTPGTGTYSTAQYASISSGTAGAAIYYTTDGTQPTTSSSLYTGSIYVTSTTTINAIAVKSGYTNSSIGTAVITINTGGGTGSGSGTGTGH